MTELGNCGNCNGEVTVDSDFCPHCGQIFEQAGESPCDTHPERKALAVCIICRKTLCEKCRTKVKRRSFCEQHQSIEVEEDWAKIYQSSDVHEAEMVKAVLAGAGVKVEAQNLSPASISTYFGEIALFRAFMRYPAKIFVPIPEFVRAMEVLQDWQSTFIDAGKSSGE